jgi:GAF domain-containing protein
VYELGAFVIIAWRFRSTSSTRLRSLAAWSAFPVAIATILACFPCMNPLWPHGMVELQRQEAELQSTLQLEMTVDQVRAVLTSRRVQFSEFARVVASDIAGCDFMAGSEDQQVYLQTGIRACQTTPLIGSDGNVLGTISTHWRATHRPSETDFQLFDALAEQAADLIEMLQERRRKQRASEPNILDLKASSDGQRTEENEA